MSSPDPHEGWFPIHEETLRRIERSFDREGARRKAMAALLAVSRIVNLEGKTTFTRRIASIATDMSYSYPHAAEALQLLASTGIITIQAQSVPNSKEKAPSVYTLEQNVLRLEPTAFTKCPRLPNNSQELPKNGSSDVSEKRACRPASSSIQIVDDHHISELGKIFTPASVAKAVASCRAWLLTPKGTGKAFSKRRLQTFLRDAEPIGAPATPPHQSTRQDIIRHSTPARIIKSINP